MTTDWILIYWTSISEEEALPIIRTLLDQSLIACANLFPLIKSIYRWKGVITEHQEVQVILKAHQNSFTAIKEKICSLTSYEIPEIIAINIAHVNPDYANWLRENSLLLD